MNHEFSAETKLISAFYGFAKTQPATTQRLEASDSDIDARMAVLEARVLAPEEFGNRRCPN